MRRAVVFAWNFIFDHEKSPLRHIPDFTVRHTVFQMLAWMWTLAFSIAIGSYTFLAFSLIGHAVLIAAAAITVATYAAASTRPDLFERKMRKQLSFVAAREQGGRPRSLR